MMLLPFVTPRWFKEFLVFEGELQVRLKPDVRRKIDVISSVTLVRFSTLNGHLATSISMQYLTGAWRSPSL
jgi:hypothetical protein